MTTHWITAYGREVLAVCDTHPNHFGDHSKLQVCKPWMWPALGLPHEIAPGECWEVRWERMSVGYDYVTDTMRSMIVPIARDVTAELKEKSDG